MTYQHADHIIKFKLTLTRAAAYVIHFNKIKK